MPAHVASTNYEKCSDHSLHCSSLASFGGFSSFTGRKPRLNFCPGSLVALSSICCCSLLNSAWTAPAIVCNCALCASNSDLACATTAARSVAFCAAVASNALLIASSLCLIVLSIAPILVAIVAMSLLTMEANAPWSAWNCVSFFV